MNIGLRKRPIQRKTRLKAKFGLSKRSSRKPKQVPISKLKKHLEALQKQLVTKLYGHQCYTCGAKRLKKKNKHLGHVPWPRSDLSTKAKYDTRFTRIQCFRCNIHLGGAGAVAIKRMMREGIDVDKMREWSDKEKGKVVPREWFEAKIQEYTKLLNGKENS